MWNEPRRKHSWLSFYQSVKIWNFIVTATQFARKHFLFLEQHLILFRRHNKSFHRLQTPRRTQMLSQSAENVVTEYSRRSHPKNEVKDVKLIKVQDAKEKCHLRLWVMHPMLGKKAECMTKRFRQTFGSSVDPAACLQTVAYREGGGLGGFTPPPPKFRSFDKGVPDCKLSGTCLVFLFQHPN
jgi:hypothetical protein